MSQAPEPTASRPGVGDLVSGAAVVLFGASVVLYARGFPELGDGAPGPALFPTVVGGLLVLFGAVLVGRWVLGRARADTAAERPSGDRERERVSRIPARAWLDAALVVASIVFYLLLSDVLGFAPTMAVLLFVLSWRLGAKLLVALGTAVLVPALIYLVFQRLLLVPLPGGLLG